MGRVLPVASGDGGEVQEVVGPHGGDVQDGHDAAEEASPSSTAVMATAVEAAGAGRAGDEGGRVVRFDGLRKSLAEKGLFETLIDIRDAFGGNNQEMVKIFPNIRALRGIFDLMGPQLESNRATHRRRWPTAPGCWRRPSRRARTPSAASGKKMMANLQITINENGDVMAAFADVMIGGMRLVVQAVAKVTSALGPFRACCCSSGLHCSGCR